MATPGSTVSKDSTVLASCDNIKDPETPDRAGPGLPNYLKGSVDNLDSYTRGIELSNACRRFYVSRVQVAEGIRAKLDKELASSGQPHLDSSMGKLRKEVVSLIDQDLSLMKQLLTLNERIEDLKWQRKLAVYNPASTTTCASSIGTGLGSDGGMLSDWESGEASGGQHGHQSHQHDSSLRLQAVTNRLTASGLLLHHHHHQTSGSERELPFSKYLSPSKLSVFRDCTYSSNHGTLHTTATDPGAPATTTMTVNRHDSSKFSRTAPPPQQLQQIPQKQQQVLQQQQQQQQHRQQLHRSTSDLGSSDELVNSVSDLKKTFRVSQADSSISMDCPSNSNSLRKSDTATDRFQIDPRASSGYDSLRLPTTTGAGHCGAHPHTSVGIPVFVEDDPDDSPHDGGDPGGLNSKEYSHDSGIQVVDHNMEMII